MAVAGIASFAGDGWESESATSESEASGASMTSEGCFEDALKFGLAADALASRPLLTGIFDGEALEAAGAATVFGLAFLGAGMPEGASVTGALSAIKDGPW